MMDPISIPIPILIFNASPGAILGPDPDPGLVGVGIKLLVEILSREQYQWNMSFGTSCPSPLNQYEE